MLFVTCQKGPSDFDLIQSKHCSAEISPQISELPFAPWHATQTGDLRALMIPQEVQTHRTPLTVSYNWKSLSGEETIGAFPVAFVYNAQICLDSNGMRSLQTIQLSLLHREVMELKSSKRQTKKKLNRLYSAAHAPSFNHMNRWFTVTLTIPSTTQQSHVISSAGFTALIYDIIRYDHWRYFLLH